MQQQQQLPSNCHRCLHSKLSVDSSNKMVTYRVEPICDFLCRTDNTLVTTDVTCWTNFGNITLITQNNQHRTINHTFAHATVLVAKSWLLTTELVVAKKVSKRGSGSSTMLQHWRPSLFYALLCWQNRWDFFALVKDMQKSNPIIILRKARMTCPAWLEYTCFRLLLIILIIYL